MIYADKFQHIVEHSGFETLSLDQREGIRSLAFEYQFTHQELKQVVEASLDLSHWDQPSLQTWWEQARHTTDLTGREQKKFLFHALTRHLETLRSTDKVYSVTSQPLPHQKLQLIQKSLPGKVFGLCPVASPKTTCCNLYTLDAVLNCGYQCSYCSIQSFFPQREITFHANFAQKLSSIVLDPQRFYHVGTGQSSDALMWGNKWGLLDALYTFARNHPNILLEFKTKSATVAHLCKHRPPQNVMVSWSLNPDRIIRHEEHGTATLSQRLSAARHVADRGIKVGFHFHPIVKYQAWKQDYQELTTTVIRNFSPDEVLFISLGTLTFAKPILRTIRNSPVKTKVHQMPFVPNPEGKLTYPDEIKTELFQHLYQCLKPWHPHVYFYLCMETQKLWQTVFGTHYESNAAFETDFYQHIRAKIPSIFPLHSR